MRSVTIADGRRGELDSWHPPSTRRRKALIRGSCAIPIFDRFAPSTLLSRYCFRQSCLVKAACQGLLAKGRGWDGRKYGTSVAVGGVTVDARHIMSFSGGFESAHSKGGVGS